MKQHEGSPESCTESSLHLPLSECPTFFYTTYIYKKVIYLVLVLMFGYFWSPVSEEAPSVKTIQWLIEEYPTQTEEFWNALEAGVEDVVEFENPRCFIFLYQQDAEQELENMLEDISEYVSLSLFGSQLDPIVLSDKVLNLPAFSKDHGEFIGKYMHDLKERGLMIVKNLDKVSTEPAHGFHFICDEHSPLVPKAVTIFTMKVNNFTNNVQNDYEYVEYTLRKQWSNMKEDAFPPLITRITSMILRVNPPRAEEIIADSFIKDIVIPKLFGLLLCGILILNLEYFVFRMYAPVFDLMKEFPGFSLTIWNSLRNTSTADRYFIISDSEQLIAGVAECIMKIMKISHCIVFEDLSSEKVKKFYRDEKSVLEEGCVVLVRKIEETEEVCQDYMEEESVRDFLTVNKIVIVFTIESKEFLVGNDVDNILDKDFLELFPSKKVIRLVGPC